MTYPICAPPDDDEPWYLCVLSTRFNKRVEPIPPRVVTCRVSSCGEQRVPRSREGACADNQCTQKSVITNITGQGLDDLLDVVYPLGRTTS